MEAFQLALSLGADVLETDVRLSRDKQVVVIHDARVDRTCNGRGAVSDLTLRALKQLDAGYHFTDLNGRHYRGGNVRLISLAELLEHLPTTRINIDIKDNCYEAVKAVANVIEQSGRPEMVNVGSFHPKAVAWFRQLAPQVTTAATRGETAHLYFARHLCRSTPYHFLQIPIRYCGLPLATRSFIQHAGKRGIKSVYWTINDAKTMRRLMALRVSGIVTDRVDIAGALLGKTEKGAPP